MDEVAVHAEARIKDTIGLTTRVLVEPPDAIERSLGMARRVIDVGAYHAALDISANTNNMVAAVITPEQLQSMLAAMDKATSMTGTTGKAASTRVPLNGSNRVITAFLTCACEIASNFDPTQD